MYNNSNCEQLVKQLYSKDIFILLGDVAYDSVKLFKLCEKISINFDIKLHKAKSYSSIKNEYRVKSLLYLQSPMGQKIYKKRLSIERLFSILKMRYGLKNSRLYGLSKHNSHVIWKYFYI